MLTAWRRWREWRRVRHQADAHYRAVLRYMGPDDHAAWCAEDHQGYCLDILLSKIRTQCTATFDTGRKLIHCNRDAGHPSPHLSNGGSRWRTEIEDPRCETF